MPQDAFSAKVSAWVAETKERAKIVRDESAQRIIETMQEPGPSRARVKEAISVGAGLGKEKKNGTRGVNKRAFGPIANPGGAGNLPVDTGFLRASLVVSIGDAMPPLVDNPSDDTAKNWDVGEVKLTITGADLTDTITAVYTAKYARRIEYGFNGTDSLGRKYNQTGTRFVALAAQQWPRIVQEVALEAQSRAAK